MKYLVFFVFLFFSDVVLSCDKSVTSLGQGDPAPCDGYLFSPEAESKARESQYTLKYTKNRLVSQEKLTDLYKRKYELLITLADKENLKAEVWRKEAERSTTALIKITTTTNYKDWVLFAGGVLTTVAAGYAIGQAGR